MTARPGIEEFSSCQSSSTSSSSASFELTCPPRWKHEKELTAEQRTSEWAIAKRQTAAGDYYAPLFSDDSEKLGIYDDLVRRKRLLQLEGEDADLQPRDYAIKELLVTEENYVETLNELIQEYQHAISVGQEQKYDILINIKDLSNFHQNFLKLLLDASKNLPGRTERLAKVFVDWQDKFLLYGEYCVRLQYAQAKISLLRQTDPGFHRILSMCRRNSSSLGRFRLEDLLVVPFQRVLKYHLLLSNIQRYEPEDSPRSRQKRSALQHAIDAMNDVNNFINEIKRDSENLKTLEDVQNRIVDFNLHCSDNLLEYGRLMLDGRLKVRLHNQSLKRRAVFLLEKAVLICRTKGDKLVFKALICLAQMRLEDSGHVDAGSERFHEFTLRDKDFLNISHSFLCHSELDKSKWIEMVAKSLINLSSNYLSTGNHNHKFSYATMPQSGRRCLVCKRYLTGLILQGFRCCLCAYEVHRDCISFATPCHSARRPTQVFTEDTDYAEGCSLFIRGDLPDLVKSTRQGFNNGGLSAPRRIERISSRGCLNVKRRCSVQTDKRRDTNSYMSLNNDVAPVANQMRERLCPDKCCKPQLCLSKRISGDFLICDNGDSIMENNESVAGLGHADIEASSRLSECEEQTASEALLGEIWFANWTRRKTEQILGREDVPENTFLVRPRESPGPCCCSEYSLSLKHSQQIFHIRIHKLGHDKSEYYLMDSLRFPSVRKLINYYMTNSLEENFPPVQSSLVYPIHTVLRINC